jgi:murein L,D-transpeptidase YcbB/YkuD
VKRFQYRHDLDQDGIIQEATLEAMNVTVEGLIRRIIVNMERWRWTTRDLGERHVLVNMAGSALGGVQGGKLELLMPVSVGKTCHKTPVFSDMIKYVEFNPYWYVPRSIAREEFLPGLKQDRNYLQGKHIRLFSDWGSDTRGIDPTKVDWAKLGRSITRFRFRQDPGPWNALGAVKFVFPNKYGVCLHGTPAEGLFDGQEPAFSHGCIRVGKPAELAVFVLGGEDKGWTIERVEQMFSSGKRHVVRLEQPMPIHLAYSTVIVGKGKVVRFLNDVYGRDELLESALFQ